MSELPFVTVIIPCRNEEQFIKGVLNDILAQDYPVEKTEVLLIDGNSADGTKNVINDFIRKHTHIFLLDNPQQVVPPAMNLGIKKARGSIIVRWDAHASYPPFYISRLVNWLIKLNADNVGGMWKTEAHATTLTAIAIAKALAHPFGIGNALYRIGIDKAVEADTVPFGCYKKNVFERIGYYDERLVRNQDIELNKRLKKSGGRIFLVPDVYCIYYSRDTFRKLALNNYKNGEWVILTANYTGTLSSLSIRHFIPLFFVVYLLTLPVTEFISTLLILPLLLHLLLNLFFSIRIAVKERKMLLIPFLFLSFLILHCSYGIGSLRGLWDIAFIKKYRNVRS